MKKNMADVNPSISNLLPISLEQALQEVIKREGYTSHSRTQTLLSKNGASYTANLHEVDVTGITHHGYKHTYLFVKYIPTKNNMDSSTLEIAFENESFVYKELCKIIKDWQDEASVPEKERLKLVKSYIVVDDCRAIVLENLARKGFKVLQRMEVLPLRFAELALQQLARLHGFSLILQHQRPGYFHTNIKPKETTILNVPELNFFFANMLNAFTKQLSQDDRKRVESSIVNADTFKKILFTEKLRSARGINVLCHGDFNKCNLLYKREGTNIEEVVMIDYQYIYYGCPIHDFKYLIFTGTDREFRRKHLDHLKDLYYTTMETYLRYSDLDLKGIWSRESFEMQYQENLSSGLGISGYTLPLVFLKDEDVQKVEAGPISEFKPQHLDDRLAARVQGIVDDFIEWGYA